MPMNQELTVSCESSSRSRNFLGVLLSILVLMLISSLIVVAIVVLNPDIVNLTNKQYTPREAITLEEAMLDGLGGNGFTYQWLAPSGNSPDLGEPQFDELLFEDAKNLNTMSIGRPLVASDGIELSPVSGSTNSSKPQVGGDNIPQHSHRRPLVKAAKLTTLISNTSLLSSIEWQGFKLSPSKRYLLVWISKRRQFRHTFTAEYFLYDIKLDLITMINTKRTETTGINSQAQLVSASVFENLDSASQYLTSRTNENDDHARFQHVDWFSQQIGDNQEPGDSLILIQNNDIYLISNIAASVAALSYSSSATGLPAPIRLTFTGKQDEIFNGVPDWLYEEEILSETAAYQMSPKSTSLAYMSFNDSQVEFMTFQHYGPQYNVIPRLQRIRYPKAGRVNPHVSVHIIDQLATAANSNDLANRQIGISDIKLELPDNLAERQHYINRIRWLTDDKLALVWLNRQQNESYFVICSRQASWRCEKNLHLTAEAGWLDLTDDLIPLDEEHYLALLFKEEGADVGAFKHVAKIAINQFNGRTFLTGGRREVIRINGIDRKRSVFYYTASVENEPGQRQLYSANLNAAIDRDGSPLATSEANCVTCDHYPEECLYNSVTMSPSANYYIFECEGPGVPRIEMRLARPAPSADEKQRQIFPPAPLMESPNNNYKEDHSLKLPPIGGNNSNNANLPVASTRFDDNAVSSSSNRPASTLLWTIEDNQALRARLTYSKAMPLTMRLKVPIPNTNYSANVLMLLPPQLGFRSSLNKLLATGNTGNGRLRSPRNAPQAPVSGSASLPMGDSPKRALHMHYTPANIAEYTSQLGSGQQYPMVVDVYGGPNSQRVDYRFNAGFGHYLASNRRTIYVMIDGRGSGGQGTKRLYELYHRLGSVEIDDQIEVTAYLTRNFSFIDPNKVAIWGWSYGGYASAMALARSNAFAIELLQAKLLKDLRGANMSSSLSPSPSFSSPLLSLPLPPPISSSSPAAATLTRPLPAILAAGHQHSKGALPLGGVFECAASVAPVTDWIYYDTAYTERYMSSPYLNEQYDESVLGDHENIDNKLDSSYLTSGGRPAPGKALEQQLLAIGSKWIPLNQTNLIDSTYLQPLAPISSPSSLAGLMQRAAGRSNNTSRSPTNRDRPQLNLNERYMNASLIEHIANIDRKRFLLIHGTADDNVHFQQSIMLMKRLIQRNVMFETRIYPDQDHGIANRADKLHLASTLSNFFAECFDMAY